MTATRRAKHPLNRLLESETKKAVAIIKKDRRFGTRMRFGSVDLHVPPKAEVLAYKRGAPIDRQVDVILLDNAKGAAVEVTVSVTNGSVTRWKAIKGVQPAVIVDEFFEAEQTVKDDPQFQAAMAKRGVTDMDLVDIDPISGGFFGNEFEATHRIVRGIAFVHATEGDNQYARPVDGLIVIVDLANKLVLEVQDHHVYPVPQEPGEWSSQFLAEPRDDVKPLEITQPDGPSFTIKGDHLTWQNWDLRVGWTDREGLVINTANFTVEKDVRQVLYRASISEMTVPYGSPTPLQSRKNAFDCGEYGLGMLANSLTLGCDCLGEIHYLDAHTTDAAGTIHSIPQAICIHEEDAGIAWKHTEFRTEHTEVRRMRRLVVSFICTVGNYEYGLYWYFYQDGRIECEVKLTGLLSTGGLDDGETTRYGTELAPNLYAPNHQHFFCMRLDTAIDGLSNSVVEVNTKPAPRKENPYGNAFYGEQTTLATESEAQRNVNPATSRYWKILSSERENRNGLPTGYKLLAGETALPFATKNSAIRKRAGYMWSNLWVTPYNASENFPAGKYPNQHAGGAGLPEWTAADRSIEDTDVVVWYVMGHNHLPSLEDWPVMPVASMGFMLKPSGFFDRSPLMDLPPSMGCH